MNRHGDVAHILDQILPWVSLAFETAGVTAIVVGTLIACIEFLKGLGRVTQAEAYQRFRTRVARSILLGLEFLVAADIIGTVAVQPTLENLAVLGVIVGIRTFLSFALELEVDGRWPWQRGQDKKKSGRQESSLAE